MIIFWNVCVLNRQSKQRSWKDLFLDTETLDPVKKATVEYLIDSTVYSTDRKIIEFRNLFKEHQGDSEDERFKAATRFATVGLVNYVEDESEIEIPLREVGQIVTGNPNVVLVPSGLSQHHIDWMFSPSDPIDLASISLSVNDMRLLGYFVRDYRELAGSAFMTEKRGPATLTFGASPKVSTAVDHEKIGSFVTVFRRLYMPTEPANFEKAVKCFSKTIGGKSLAKLVEGEWNSYRTKLDAVADPGGFQTTNPVTFTRRLLIEVFIYTQYAHQPSKGTKFPDRQQEFNSCLSQLDGERDVLTWLFLTEIWKTANSIKCAGKIITSFLTAYCDHHKVVPDIVDSASTHHPGLGAIESHEALKARILVEQAEKLATDIWKERGSPEGGAAQFQKDALDELRRNVSSR